MICFLSSTLCRLALRALVAVIAASIVGLSCSDGSSPSYNQLKHEYDLAFRRQHWDQAVEISRSYQAETIRKCGYFSRAHAELLISIGMVWESLRQLDSTEIAYRQALQVLDSLDTSVDSARFICYSRPGGVLNYIGGQGLEAESLLLSAKALRESGLQLDLVGWATVEFYLARAYASQGGVKVPEALEAYDRASSWMVDAAGLQSAAVTPILREYSDLCEAVGDSARLQSIRNKHHLLNP